jgi:hypothetical protein
MVGFGISGGEKSDFAIINVIAKNKQKSKRF